jgi:hypothetical protein
MNYKIFRHNNFFITRRLTSKVLVYVVLPLLVATFLFATMPVQKTRAAIDHKVYLPLVMTGGVPSDNQLCPAGDQQWLCLLNQYRDAAAQPDVLVNANYADSLDLHTRYLLLNPGQTDLHAEYPSNPGYTPQGKEAGGQSNMSWKGSVDFTTTETMALWMGVATHRYNMLHPNLSASGYDLSCDGRNCAAGLNILGSLPLSYNISDTDVIYPGENQRGIPAVAFPVTWAFYMPWYGTESDADEVDLISGEIYDQQNQKIGITRWEPNHTDGRWDYKNQVVLTPVEPLLSGQTYRVEITVRFRGETLQRNWSFSTR